MSRRTTTESKFLRAELLEFVVAAVVTCSVEDKIVRHFAQRAFYYMEDGSARDTHVVPKRYADGRRF